MGHANQKGIGTDLHARERHGARIDEKEDGGVLSRIAAKLAAFRRKSASNFPAFSLRRLVSQNATHFES